MSESGDRTREAGRDLSSRVHRHRTVLSSRRRVDTLHARRKPTEARERKSCGAATQLKAWPTDPGQSEPPSRRCVPCRGYTVRTPSRGWFGRRSGPGPGRTRRSAQATAVRNKSRGTRRARRYIRLLRLASRRRCRSASCASSDTVLTSVAKFTRPRSRGEARMAHAGMAGTCLVHERAPPGRSTTWTASRVVDALKRYPMMASVQHYIRSTSRPLRQRREESCASAIPHRSQCWDGRPGLRCGVGGRERRRPTRGQATEVRRRHFNRDANAITRDGARTYNFPLLNGLERTLMTISMYEASIRPSCTRCAPSRRSGKGYRACRNEKYSRRARHHGCAGQRPS